MTGLSPRQSATLTVGTDAVPFFLDALEPFSESVNASRADMDDEVWSVTAVLMPEWDHGAVAGAIAMAAAASGIDEPGLSMQPLQDVDWLAQLQQDFPPFRVGRFFVHGSHHVPRPGEGPLRLLVNAGMAFGSGEHATTQGCLLAMQALARKGQVGDMLDMGCGSGILSLAAAKLWRARVTAVDIDDEAARVTRANARLNGVAGLIRAGAGNGYQAPILADRPRFQLVASNIVARPLKRMAPDLARSLAPGGHAILSGLLSWQEAGVLAAHRAQGLRLVARLPIGEWRTLVLRG